jgi:DNA-binding NtrC family response regulator
MCIDKASTTTVLVIEEHDGIRAALRGLLEDEAFRVLDAADAETAGPMLDHEHEHVDLMVINFALPEDAVAEIVRRATTSDPELAVLYLVDAAPADDARLRVALERARTAFVRWPLSFDDLLVEAQVLLSGRIG